MAAKWHSAVTVPQKPQQFPEMSWFAVQLCVLPCGQLLDS